MKKSNKEIIIHGPLWRGIILIAIPLILRNMIETLYNLADAWWVGRIGAEEFAATSFVWPVLFLFISIGIGISMAGNSILSQLIGAGDNEEASKYASLIYLLSIVLAIFISIVGFFITPTIIYWMGATGRFAQLSITYLRILFLGIPLQFLAFATNGVFQSQGMASITTILSAIAVVLNIVINPLFIFDIIPGTNIQGLGLGVAGAAWATVFAQGVLVVLGFYFLFKTSELIRPNFKGKIWDNKKALLIGRVGIPATIGQSGAAFGFIIFNSIIAEFGTTTLAAFSLVNRISGMGMLPAMAIGQAMTTVVGQNMGNDNLVRVRRSLGLGLGLSILVTLILSLPIYFFDYNILHFLLPEPMTSPVMKLALSYIIYALILNPFMGCFSVLQGFFQGTGHTRYSMLMEVFRLWGVRLPYIWFMQYIGLWFDLGIWHSMIISNILVVVIGLMFYRYGKWMKGLSDFNRPLKEVQYEC